MITDSQLELSPPSAACIGSSFAAFSLEARLIAGGRRRQEEALQELEKRVQAWSVDAKNRWLNCSYWSSTHNDKQSLCLLSALAAVVAQIEPIQIKKNKTCCAPIRCAYTALRGAA